MACAPAPLWVPQTTPCKSSLRLPDTTTPKPVAPANLLLLPDFHFFRLQSGKGRCADLTVCLPCHRVSHLWIRPTANWGGGESQKVT